MKKLLSLITTFMFPWFVLLLNDNPGGALVALAMQGTVIGWPFASLWAWRTLYPIKK